MMKTKWLKFSAALSIQQISDLLSARQFKKDNLTGFELIEVKRNALKGKFIEEITEHEVLVDPFGEEITYSFRRFIIFDFLILPTKKNEYILRADNPPRSMKSFLLSISDAFGFGFTVIPLDIDITKMIEHLKFSKTSSSWSMKKVLMENVRIGTSSLAKIEVRSAKDAYSDLAQQLDIQNAQMTRVTIQTKNANPTRTIELTSKGMITGELENIEELTGTFKIFFT